jgi:AcrR family transcriptional regulator
MGRHKQFVREDIIEKALQVFWRKGFVDTSLKDLEEATGVFKPVLYSEFGDKEGLYIHCVQYYREHHSSHLILAREPSGWTNIQDFFKFVLPNKNTRGCLFASASSRDMPVLTESLKPILEEQQKNLLKGIRKNLTATELSADKINPISEMIFTYYCGLSTLSNISPRSELEKGAMQFLELLRKS